MGRFTRLSRLYLTGLGCRSRRMGKKRERVKWVVVNGEEERESEVGRGEWGRRERE